MEKILVNAGIARGDIRALLQRMLDGEVFVLTHNGVVTNRILFDSRGFIQVIEGNRERTLLRQEHLQYLVDEQWDKIKQEVSAGDNAKG